MPDTHLAALDTEGDRRRSLVTRFQKARGRTAELVGPLSPEDLMIQSVPDGAPAKWHLAHTTWLFETTVLIPFSQGYRPHDPCFLELFKARAASAEGRIDGPVLRLLSRPSTADILRYRDHVNGAVLHLIDQATDGELDILAEHLGIAIAHERRHQERLLTHIKHAFWSNPLRPAYESPPELPATTPPPDDWVAHDGGLVEVGREEPQPGFDHEGPRHRVFLAPFRLAARPVSCGEFRAFVEAGGYGERALWMADGWEALRAEGWTAPLYWEKRDGAWRVFTLYGSQPLNPDEPVCHVSWYEADAFARWAGKRLPAEAEWETIAARCDSVGNLLGTGYRHPRAGSYRGAGPWQMCGDVWEWTRSAFGPYPGYRQPDGLDEAVHGRFMSNRMVLRGGSCVTPFDHAGPWTRHYLRPDSRLSFTGFRLAEDA
ncbi:ergothioneine biosynthesis protein EgtB [Azospirillum doebereinerae]|uniref:ergothioneine biosynthesis protein EgtB n=1 Tax=Azospirillum doebereinerae TaxID=92933 RepID=UPI001EE55D98|nr:ergothioneine biosynthesis protein EgtB [Azospirillum doebereinerae]